MIAISIIVLGVLIIFHELGHFIVAKLSDIKVEEFSVGMGPKLAGFKKGETLYSLRLFPIGGYCKMLGEDESSADIRAFSNKPVLVRFAVAAAGSLMNFLVAVLIFIAMGFITVTPVPVVQSVIADYPAAEAGIMPGDVIVKVDGYSIKTWSDLQAAVSKSVDKPVLIEVKRAGKVLDFKVTPVYDEKNKKPMIGITPKGKIGYNNKASLGVNVKNSIYQSFYITRVMLSSLTGLITGRVSVNDFMGPVGIISVVGEAARSGFYNLLGLTSLISLNLAIINLLPIPALDGSRLLFLLVEAVRRRPIDREKEGLIHFIGFIFLILFMIFMTYKDILRLSR